MTIKIYENLEQGTDEWLQARCGLITASEVKLILTPSLKVANNQKMRIHMYELLAQRITNYVEPTYIGDHMIRGNYDEVVARNLYSEKYSPVKEVGFITNDKFGFTIGYSPDGLVGNDGLIEVKSRMQKHQIKTICDGDVPDDFILQCQTALLVSERDWLDFISYCGGMPLFCFRVFPDERYHDAILEACQMLEEAIKELKEVFEINSEGLLMTERENHNEEEIII